MNNKGRDKLIWYASKSAVGNVPVVNRGGNMENSKLGRVTVNVTIENMEDLFDVYQGRLNPGEVRTVVVADALVDTGASTLLLPKRFISQLGLRLVRTRQAEDLGGSAPVPRYSVVRLTIQGRDCSLEVGEIDDKFPVLIGQIPLEMLDWVVDTKN